MKDRKQPAGTAANPPEQEPLTGEPLTGELLPPEEDEGAPLVPDPDEDRIPSHLVHRGETGVMVPAPGIDARPERYLASGDLHSAEVGEVLYSSLDLRTATREERIAVYNAVSQQAASIKDMASNGERFVVKHVVAHKVEFAGVNDGEIVECARIVLLSDDGTFFATTATGVLSSLRKMFRIVGEPPYDPPLRIRPRMVPTRRFATLILEVEG